MVLDSTCTDVTCSESYAMVTDEPLSVDTSRIGSCLNGRDCLMAPNSSPLSRLSSKGMPPTASVNRTDSASLLKGLIKNEKAIHRARAASSASILQSKRIAHAPFEIKVCQGQLWRSCRCRRHVLFKFIHRCAHVKLVIRIACFKMLVLR
jgi:hypothetical protein